MSEAVAVVVIGSLIGPCVVAYLSWKLRQENSSQHAEGRALTSTVLEHLETLDHRSGRMETRQERMEGKLDGALSWQVRHEIDHSMKG